MMLKFYADESVDKTTSLMNISGFLMTEDQFVALDGAVQEARGDLPYFHMKEGHHVTHPDIYKKLVGLISKQSVICGLSASLYMSEHKEMTRLKTNGQSMAYWMGTPYTYLLGVVMSVCAEWLDVHQPSNEFIAYVFENGHPNQGDADHFWGQLSKPRHSGLKNRYRYASHTFIDGKGPLGSVLQLGDILAWNMNKNDREKRPLQEVGDLLPVPILAYHHGPKEMLDVFTRQIQVWQELSVERFKRHLRHRNKK